MAAVAVTPLASLLRPLADPQVQEIALVSDKPVRSKVGGKYQDLDATPLSEDRVLSMLIAAGGSRKLELLSDGPQAWSFKVPSIGLVAVEAVRNDDFSLAARFVVMERTKIETTPPQSKRSRASMSIPPQSKKEKTLAKKGSSPPGEKAEKKKEPSLVIEPPPEPRIELKIEPKHAMVPSPAVLGGGSDDRDRARAAERRALKQETSLRISAPPMVPAALESLLAKGRAAGATDVHVIAERPLLLRIAGNLTPSGDTMRASEVEKMIGAIVPHLLEDSFAKSGTADFALEAKGCGRFRVNVTRQLTGLKACFRTIASELPSIESLALPPGVAQAMHHHQGLIVVTGPSGHGKTTTLTALVDLVNRDTTHHIITVEDPVEYVHPRKKAMISQREVGTHTQSFRTALKASLREDPDVIVIGELRDTDTVRTALSASETGHLVIGTMNTPSAAKTIDRLIDLFPPGDQQQVRMTLAGGLKLIVGQRLVPAADGRGVAAAVELLPGNVPLWNLIRENRTFQIPSLQQRGKSMGIIRLDDSLAALVLSKRVTLEAALPYAESAAELKQKVTGEPAAQPFGAPGQAGQPGHGPGPGAPGAPGQAPGQPGAPQKERGFFDKAGDFFGRKGGGG